MLKLFLWSLVTKKVTTQAGLRECLESQLPPLNPSPITGRDFTTGMCSLPPITGEGLGLGVLYLSRRSFSTSLLHRMYAKQNTKRGKCDYRSPVLSKLVTSQDVLNETIAVSFAISFPTQPRLWAFRFCLGCRHHLIPCGTHGWKNQVHHPTEKSDLRQRGQQLSPER